MNNKKDRFSFEFTGGEWIHTGSYLHSKQGMICELSEPKVKFLEHKPIELNSNAWDIAMANGELIALAPEMFKLLFEISFDPHNRAQEAAQEILAKSELRLVQKLRVEHVDLEQGAFWAEGYTGPFYIATLDTLSDQNLNELKKGDIVILTFAGLHWQTRVEKVKVIPFVSIRGVDSD